MMIVMDSYGLVNYGCNIYPLEKMFGEESNQ